MVLVVYGPRRVWSTKLVAAAIGDLPQANIAEAVRVGLCSDESHKGQRNLSAHRH